MMESRDTFAPDATPLLAYLAVLRDQPTGDAVTYAMARGLLAPYGAEMAMIYSARPDGHVLDLVGSHGLGPREGAAYSIVTTDMHLPGVETYRTGAEKFLAAKQVAEDYPLSAPFFRDLPPSGDIGFIPLLHRGAPIGFLVLTFAGPLDRTWQLRATLQGLVDATALWVIADNALHGEGRSLRALQPPMEFTARHREILVRMRQGAANREIAEGLGYSIATIKADIATLSAMLGAKGRADLLVRAKRAGL
jgi:DNA-binding CsgD family transcriptional regulator